MQCVATRKKYFLYMKNLWWTEQLAWSLCSARVENRFFWKGKSAAVLSGFKTRSSSEIESDCVKFLSSKERLTGEEISMVAKNTSVLHLAGLGKHH